MRMWGVSCAANSGGAAAGRETHGIAVLDAIGAGHLRMDLRERDGRHFQQRVNTAGLRSGLVLRHDAAGGQIKRILAVGLFGGRLKCHGMKTRAAIGGGEPFQKHSRRAGVGDVGQGQKTPSSRSMRS